MARTISEIQRHLHNMVGAPLVAPTYPFAHLLYKSYEARQFAKMDAASLDALLRMVLVDCYKN